MKSLKQTALAAGILLAAAGCDPKVVTDMYTNEFAAVSPDSVRLFVKGEKMPPSTRAIGEVKVVDNGFSTKGTLERVLQMAVEATAKNGGNALVITEHRTPDMRSTINRVWGTMLRMPDDAADSLPTMTVQELLAQRMAAAGRGYQQEMERQQQLREERRKLQPLNVLRVSAGPSVMTSEFITNYRTYKSRTGFDLLVDYDHLWKSGFGFGINYLYNSTSFDGDYNTHIHYFGPSLVMALATRKWRFDGAWGVGYAHYTESLGNQSESEDNAAIFFRAGAEYRVAKHLAIGLQMHTLSMPQKKPEGVELKKNEFYGIRHLSPHVRLCYYL